MQWQAAISGIHIHLNVNELLRQTGVPYTAPKFPFVNQVTPEEMKFLFFVRLKEFSSVTIHFKNGEISKFEGDRECVLSERIGDLITRTLKSSAEMEMLFLSNNLYQ